MRRGNDRGLPDAGLFLPWATCTNECFGRGRSSARLERRPVTSEVVGSNSIGPANFKSPPMARNRLKAARYESERVTNLKLTEQTRSVSHESALRGRHWVVIDAAGRALGRVASRAASVLRGKHRPDFTPNQDAGDFVVIINAAKVKLTGNKLTDKVYHRHTGFPGG